MAFAAAARSYRSLRPPCPDAGSEPDAEELAEPRASMRPLFIAEAEPRTLLPSGRVQRTLSAALGALAFCLVTLASTRETTRWLRGDQKDGTSLVSLVPPGSTTIRWLAHPEKCLDVAGHRLGAGLQIWDCTAEDPHQQRFLVPPPGVVGRVRWALHPDFCLDNPHGVSLQFWECDGAPGEHMRWVLSPDGKGRIHLAAKADHCVDVPREGLQNGWKLQLWPCDSYRANGTEGDMRFATAQEVVDCEWDAWQDWGACSFSCGGGMRLRKRRIKVNAVNGGRGCGSAADGTEVCNAAECPTTTLRPKGQRGGAGARAPPLFPLIAAAAASLAA